MQDIGPLGNDTSRRLRLGLFRQRVEADPAINESAREGHESASEKTKGATGEVHFNHSTLQSA